MDAVTVIDSIGEVLVFCSNNYLGLANHPEVLAAAAEGLRRYGAGTASVRFICGSFECHRALEEKTAEFFGTEAALSYTSCWNANEGLLPTLGEAGDAIVSDALNHASIIDAGRLSRATRKVYAHSDIESLEEALTATDDAAVRLVITDGVFSMEGDVAKLPELRAACDRHDAVLIVDDSHGTGVLGAAGRGAHEHLGLACGTAAGVDVLTSTYGKALGGGNGGFVAGSRDLIDYLIQRSRPHLFSNALAPPTACAALKALEILEREPERVARLHANVATMRNGLRDLGYDVTDSPTGIIPIMIGDTAEAIRMSERLLQMGVFVVGFGFPVVPEGHARLRVQMSAAHTDAQIDRSLEAFAALRKAA
jgi:glycine C-acetyltransferase